jgi:hypothetical protein
MSDDETKKASETYLRAAAALADLPIREEHFAAVLAAFEVITAQAKLVTAFELPETTDAAPRFIA